MVSLADSWHQLGGRAFEHTGVIAAALPPDSPHRGWMTYWDFRRTWDTEVDEQVVLRAVQTAEGALRAEVDPAPLAALLAYGTDLGIDVGLGGDLGRGLGRRRPSPSHETSGRTGCSRASTRPSHAP